MSVKYLSDNVKEAVTYASGLRIDVWVLGRNLEIINILMVFTAVTLESNYLESDYRGKRRVERREKRGEGNRKIPRLNPRTHQDSRLPREG